MGKFGDDSLFDGLADPVAEMTYFDGGDDERAARVIKTRDGHRRVVSFSEDNEVTVDEESASLCYGWNTHALNLLLRAGRTPLGARRSSTCVSARYLCAKVSQPCITK